MKKKLIIISIVLSLIFGQVNVCYSLTNQDLIGKWESIDNSEYTYVEFLNDSSCVLSNNNDSVLIPYTYELINGLLKIGREIFMKGKELCEGIIENYKNYNISIENEILTLTDSNGKEYKYKKVIQEEKINNKNNIILTKTLDEIIENADNEEILTEKVKLLTNAYYNNEINSKQIYDYIKSYVDSEKYDAKKTYKVLRLLYRIFRKNNK